MMRSFVATGLLFGALLTVGGALAQDSNAKPIVLERRDATVTLEAYAPNIVRITLSLNKDAALAGPGYGVSAKPDDAGWSYTHTDTTDTFRSDRMTVAMPVPHYGANRSKYTCDTCQYFSGSTPPVPLTVNSTDGTTLLKLDGWSMSVPNHKDGNAEVLNEVKPSIAYDHYDPRPADAGYFQVGATFASPDDEHYYGLGENQQGYLDHRGHPIRCWNDYDAPAAPTFCVPFLVTNKGYAVLWDNPSKTTIEPGFNEQTRWISQVGDRVSFFVIAGGTTDELYEGYRRLTGDTPMLPRAAYGYIQCKQRYSSQAEVMAVANGYRERHLPLDVIVVDWFYYTNMGQMDFDPRNWPDPKAMNDKLHAMGIQTMISVWPRFVPTDRFYREIAEHGWFEHLADGTPTNGLPYDKAGSDIDTTNPAAAQWYWDTIKDNILSKGFDSLWADETEPDLPPNGSYFHIGPGTEYFNVYPLFHTGALYDGFRRDETDRRALILSRDGYLGVQHNGTIVWSSDIYPTWDTLRRQVPTGLDVTASGLAYWSNDTGGWQGLPAVHHPEHPPLLDPSDARANVGGDDDYPELYTRWFEYAAFLPIMRTHGTRKSNEVWSYGKQAEPILEKYLKLRYTLMPYIYSLGWRTHETGAPIMRALFMDFPNDPKVAEIGDEYMFGPAFLVAPVTEQGQTTKAVYLPAGTNWYNYWTHERVHGGQTVDVAAPIDKMPLFVRAGSIVPLGSRVESTVEKQTIMKVEVWPGADADFTLYQDDGKTYAYEKGDDAITRLHWDDAAGKLTHSGAAAWTGGDSQVVEVVR
ncbi:MAG TPA: glycoside hydrolase family 31 protein [Acidobacteriaceae bacterium]|nr:glycoside hydrolase family 31 protein [Acidobacteriaceae bacterium]